jgi:hypothetical protein
MVEGEKKYESRAMKIRGIDYIVTTYIVIE